MKVVDASAMLELLVSSSKAAALESILADDLFAPDLLVAEVVNALRGLVRRGAIDDTEASTRMEVLTQSGIEYLHVWPRAERLWELRHTVSPYDACYVVLAEELQAPLVTTDQRLARAVARIVPVIAV